jgi:hypothetical protein
MKVFDLMSKLHKSTDSALMETQLGHIPLVYELQKEKFPSNIKYRHELRDSNSYRVLKQDFVRTGLDDSKFMNANDLYKNGKVRKIICVDQNGYKVNDSTINIIIDERTFFINSTDPYAELKYCIVFMEDIVYDKSSVIFGITNGMFVGGIGTNECISSKNLFMEAVFTTDGLIEPKQLNARYKVFKENIYVVKNGKFLSHDVTHVYGNVFKINDFTDTDNWFVYIIYYKDEECIDNVNKLESKIRILDGMFQELPNYIEKMSDDFDYRIDPNKSYKENLHDILNYISNYNHEGLLQLYLENKTSIIEEYTGKYMISLTKPGDICAYLPRRRNGKQYNYIIMYVNGLLYKYHDEIEYNITNIKIPLKEINHEDEILIQFFLDCGNNTYNTTFTKGATNTINFRYITTNPANIELYSPEFEGKHLYDLPVDDTRPLKVDYEYTMNGKDMEVELENPYLYGKELAIVNKRQFRHQKMQIPIKYRNKLRYKAYSISTILSTYRNNIPNNIDEFNALFSNMTATLESIIDIPNELNFIGVDEFPPEYSTDTFAIELEGCFWVEKEDIYNIVLLSNAGSRLYIDDQLMTVDINGRFNVGDVDNGPNRCNILLDRGYHNIKIDYVNNVEHPLLQLAWKGSTEQYYSMMNGDFLYQELPDYYILKLNETDFKYCLNFGHFIMFNDGRRLYDNEAYVKLHGIDQVYDQSYIIISKPIPEGDFIDIFYVPDIILEVYREDRLPEDGYITVDKDNMLNTNHPELCNVYVNGKLINPKHMINLNTNTMKIKSNIHTKSSVCVLKTNMYDGYTDAIFEYSNDVWTEVTNGMSLEVKNKYLGDYEDIIDEEPDYFKPPCVDLIWAIIKKFWIDRFGVIDAEMLFQYNDDPRVLRKTKFLHDYIESTDYEDNSNIEYKLYDQDYHKYHKFICKSPTALKFGKHENLDPNKKYSISMSVSLYLNLSQPTDRFYCELYGSGGTKQIPLCYNQETSLDISQVPKVYMLRLYLDNIPITSDFNNLRVVCNFKNSEEFVKFEDGIFLEEHEFSNRNIESIIIDPSVITGVKLPYGSEFDKE